jgi:restriction system protein
MKAWLVRAGAQGENDSFCLENGASVIGWEQIGDMSPYSEWGNFVPFVESSYPSKKKGAITNYSGQLYAFAHRIEIGDLICLPLKTTKQLAIGRVIGPYEYNEAGATNRRHTRKMEWLRTDVARAAVKQDLLYSLGAFMTVCEIKRNDGAWRLGEIAKTGIDPGSRNAAGKLSLHEDTEATIEAVDVTENAADRLRQYIAEEFAGHDLAHLVGAILTAEGFVCAVSPEGPDGGIDIYAGRGPLGLDAPRLLVQVKSGTGAIDAPTVRQLHGVISTHGADQGLLVAWGGINKVAGKELTTQRFNLRIWDANDVIESVTRNYQRLPDSIKTRLPLRQIWALAEEV